MRLYLINPSNPLVTIVNVRDSRWNRFRVWKPLGLLMLAGGTPADWDTSIIDENLGVPDYSTMPRPDLVGITAFTSQANRAYEIARHFRAIGVPVVMGGIHATACTDEALTYVDSVVTGEADGVWTTVLEDARNGRLKRRYDGGLADMSAVPLARNDLLLGKYAFGSIQTTRGCPLNCSFCSVTSFSGAQYRHRPIADVVQEFRSIRERRVLIVDDNLIGTRSDHIARAKELFRAMADAKLRKEWVCQVTINFADDEELMVLARRAGCRGVFIGFESPTQDGLKEIGKEFNLRRSRDLPASVRRIKRHRILVVGSFVLGLDVDQPGIGRRISQAATEYGLDHMNVLFLTPLPGTRLWDEMRQQGRVPVDAFPGDWKYYTLTYPVAQYRHFSPTRVAEEMIECNRHFYSLASIARRAWRCLRQRREPLMSLIGGLSYRGNIRLDRQAYSEFVRELASRASQQL